MVSRQVIKDGPSAVLGPIVDGDDLQLRIFHEEKRLHRLSNVARLVARREDNAHRRQLLERLFGRHRNPLQEADVTLSDGDVQDEDA